MSQLAASEYELFLDCIRELHSFRDVAALRLWLLDTALPKLVPSDWLSYNEVDLLNPANTLAILKPDANPSVKQLFPRFRQLAYQHPLIKSQLGSLNLLVQKISDVLCQSDFHQLELYQEFYRPLGMEHQIAVTIKTELGQMTLLVLSRRQNDYTERDRAVLEMLRPHLVAAFNHLALAGECQHLRESSALTLNEFSSATIIVNLQGRILHHVGPGPQWIGTARAGFLPAAITAWIKEHPLNASRQSLCLPSSAGKVHIRAVPTTSRERILLVLTLEGDSTAEPADNAFSLTRRESEVARWICQGKTNAEIAVILGISPRTVHKHVEHIFARLGVESRVALTVRLLENRPPPAN